MESIRRYLTGSAIARLITALLSFLSLLNLSIGYYKFLRWVVFLTSLYSVFISYNNNHKINFSIWLFGLIAILFNPFFPFYLGKEIWRITDLIVGIIFILSIFFMIEEIQPTK